MASSMSVRKKKRFPNGRNILPQEHQELYRFQHHMQAQPAQGSVFRQIKTAIIQKNQKTKGFNNESQWT